MEKNVMADEIPIDGKDTRALRHWAKRHEEFFPGLDGERNKTTVLLEGAADEIERLNRANAEWIDRLISADRERGRLRAALEWLRGWRMKDHEAIDCTIQHALGEADTCTVCHPHGNAALAGDAKPETVAPYYCTTTDRWTSSRTCPDCGYHTTVAPGGAVPASASPNIAESNDRADAAPKCRLPTFKDCGVCMEYPFCGCGAQAWTDRIRVALLPYVRHTHPNCHDVKAPGSTERHGCLCGLADALAMPLVQPPAAPATERKP
jgi:hypothetical protein